MLEITGIFQRCKKNVENFQKFLSGRPLYRRNTLGATHSFSSQVSATRSFRLQLECFSSRTNLNPAS